MVVRGPKARVASVSARALESPYRYGFPRVQSGVFSRVSSGAFTVAGTRLRSAKTERVEMNRYWSAASFNSVAESRTQSGASARDAELSMTASHRRPFSASSWWAARSPVSSSTPLNMPGALRPRLKIVTSWPRSTA